MIRLQVTVGAGKLMLEKTRRKAILRAAGREVVSVAKRLASHGGSGRVYYGPGGSAARYRGGYSPGRYQASAPGQPPARITGTLTRSFTVWPDRDGEKVTIKDTAFYARFLEAGARGGKPSGRKGVRGKRNLRNRRGELVRVIGQRELATRPFLTAALDQRASSLGERIQTAFVQDIKFVRQKA